MLFLLLFVMVCWSISAGLVALASVSTPHISDDSSIPDFEYNHDNRLANNMLIYQNSQECKSLAEQLVSMHPYDRKLAPATTEFHSAFFGSDPIDGECNVACLEIGSPSHLVTHVFPHRIHSIKSVDESYSWYHKTCQKKEIGFCNTQEGLVNVYWMNDDGERVWVGNVTTGERNTFWISSFVGHSFEVTDSESGVLLGQFTVHSDSFFSFEKLESFRAVDFVPEQYPDLTTAVGDIFETEYERHNSVSRHFTGVGFNKGRLPKDLFNSMTTFYYNNHPYRIHELANRKSVYINWWESDIHYISMPYRLRKYWQGRLKDLVEAWSNTKLELTDIYGLRQYNEGARLLSHVDRTPTHAASLIINIAQGNLAEPWNVQIHDHADRLHEVAMEEGDIVYYESAKCLHGRMAPLTGKDAFYVNLFAHYRPDGDPEWSSKPIPEGQAEKIISLDNVDVNTVMPHLAATKKILHSGRDLLDLWQRSAAGGSSIQGYDEL